MGTQKTHNSTKGIHFVILVNFEYQTAPSPLGFGPPQADGIWNFSASLPLPPCRASVPACRRTQSALPPPLVAAVSRPSCLMFTGSLPRNAKCAGNDPQEPISGNRGQETGIRSQSRDGYSKNAKQHKRNPLCDSCEFCVPNCPIPLGIWVFPRPPF